MGIKITGSFDNAIAQLKEMAEIADKATRDSAIMPILQTASQNAQARFVAGAAETTETNVYGVSHQDIPSSVTPSKKGKTQFRVEAVGQDTLFLEFGTGIWYNGSGLYPLPKPNGVKGIGEYWEKKGYPPSWGTKNKWGFYPEGLPHTKQNLVLTHGNRAYMPMYYCREEVKNEIIKRFKLK